MSPLSWPLMWRRDPYADVVPAVVRVESNVRVAPTPTGPPPEPAALSTADEDHAVMYRNHRWLRVEEDVVLARLARLTDRYGPWTAAVRLFTDTDPKETP